MAKRKVERTRAGGKWTEARYWQFVRSALRQASMRWPVKADCLKKARREYHGDNNRQKWEYLCSECGGWFMGKDVQVDHKVECGTLKCAEDLPVFVTRLFCEEEGLRVQCKPCHKKRHDVS